MRSGGQQWVPVAAAAVAAVAAIGGPALALSVGQTNASSGVDPPTGGATVLIQPLGPAPATLGVRTGQAVTFEIDAGDEPSAGTPHEIVSGAFRCPVMTSGSCSHRFEAPGRYRFTDATNHNAAVGVIVVRSR